MNLTKQGDAFMMDNSYHSSCSCTQEKETVKLDSLSLAMAYVPWQKWGDLYDPCKALKCGTLFPVLSKPFAGGRV